MDFEYGPPMCTCGCMCCEECEFCGPYKDRPDLFAWDASSGMWVIPGKETEVLEFIAQMSKGAQHVMA